LGGERRRTLGKGEGENGDSLRGGKGYDQTATPTFYRKMPGLDERKGLSGPGKEVINWINQGRSKGKVGLKSENALKIRLVGLQKR